MKHRIFTTSLLTLCAVALAASSARAALVTWTFNPAGLNGNVGSPSKQFTSSGFNITATGYDHVSSGADPFHQLYYKNEPPEGGAIETGLGLFNTNANELNIRPDGSVEQYLQLDLRSILGQGFTGGEVAVASLQMGEGFRLFGSNAAGVLGTQLPGSWTGLAFDNNFVSIPDFGLYQFVSIAAITGRVLPVAFQAFTPIPEFNSLLPVIGLIAVVSSAQLLRSRRLAQRSGLSV